MPDTIPDAGPTEATAVLLLLHRPVVAVVLNVVTDPTQTVAAPDMGAGRGLTVTRLIAIQPEGSIYVIMAVPSPTPVTIPVPAPTEATPERLLLHDPPVEVLLRVVDCPWQSALLPVMADGNVYTVQEHGVHTACAERIGNNGGARRYAADEPRSRRYYRRTCTAAAPAARCCGIAQRTNKPNACRCAAGDSSRRWIDRYRYGSDAAGSNRIGDGSRSGRNAGDHTRTAYRGIRCTCR